MNGPSFVPASTLFHARARTRHTRWSCETRGPSTPAPDYSLIDGNVVNKALTRIFHSKLQAELSPTFKSPNTTTSESSASYSDVIGTVNALSRQHSGDPTALSAASQRVIGSLFPSWLPPTFRTLFSEPMPWVAARLNAVVTVATTQWLMGPSRLADNGASVHIDRCRYLEETGCVAVCLHSCKAATEQYFDANMGIPVRIEPNLDDYSCKFQFGQAPLPQSQDDMYSQPCFVNCPSRSRAGRKTDGNEGTVVKSSTKLPHQPCHRIEGTEKNV